MSKASEMLENAGYGNDPDGVPLGRWFRVGDVVQLKSGGPHMTVTALHPFYVTAAYFDNDNRLTDSNFPPDALQPVSTEPIQEPEDTSYADMARG
jgi:uncharacterized protein YodC (DUF2158 family)